MLVGGSARDTAAAHAFAPGGGGGDQASPVMDGERRGHGGYGCGGVPPVTEGRGSRAAEGGERRSSSEPD